MRMLSILLLAMASTAAQAEVFKCTGTSGKTLYQSKPCQAAEKVRQLDIKVDPAKEAEAKAKRDALEQEYDTRRATRLEAEKEAAAQKNQAEQTQVLKQGVVAQQQQAVAQQRQAEALERQNRQNNRLRLIGPAVLPRSLLPAMPAPSATAEPGSRSEAIEKLRNQHKRPVDAGFPTPARPTPSGVPE